MNFNIILIDPRIIYIFIMQSFTQFLGESKRWLATDFKAALATTSDSRVATRYLPKILEGLNAYATGEVPNPRYLELKDIANRFAEAVTDIPPSLYELYHAQRARTGTPPDWIEHGRVYAVHTVFGKLKKAQAAQRAESSPEGKQFFNWIIPILTELAPLAAALDDMKKRAVKRVTKTGDEKKAEKSSYVKAFASNEATQAVYNGLKNLTDQLLPAYSAGLQKWWVELAKKYNAMTPQERKNQAKQNRFQVPFIATLPIWDRTGYSTGAVTLKKNYTTILKEQADTAGKQMQEEFLYKNVSKLKSIVEAKGVNLVDVPKPINLSTSGGIFTGELVFNFTDKSSFRVRNKVVVKSNYYGTVFNQFPTTFHDVKLPDGTTMSAPSEERMNTVFVKAK